MTVPAWARKQRTVFGETEQIGGVDLGRFGQREHLLAFACDESRPKASPLRTGNCPAVGGDQHALAGRDAHFASCPVVDGSMRLLARLLYAQQGRN